jgi:hypothetical protein
VAGPHPGLSSDPGSRFPPADYFKELAAISPQLPELVVTAIRADSEREQKKVESNARLAERTYELETERMRREFDEARLGQVFGLIIAVFFLSSATWLAYLGHEIPATALGITGFVAIVGKFVQGRRATTPDDTGDHFGGITRHH